MKNKPRELHPLTEINKYDWILDAVQMVRKTPSENTLTVRDLEKFWKG